MEQKSASVKTDEVSPGKDIKLRIKVLIQGTGHTVVLEVINKNNAKQELNSKTIRIHLQEMLKTEP